MKIAFIGVGHVGFALASRLVALGHEVTVGARNPGSASVKRAMERAPSLEVKTIEEAVADAEVVFLATPYDADEGAIQASGDLSGKVLVDCTNPVGPLVSHALHSDTSGGEEVQRLAEGAKVVKAFSIYGYENFADSAYPGYGDLKPAMLIAGDDAGAKETVSTLCRELGWEPVDTGGIAMSLHLEHMALLWIQIARVQGRGADFVWALLEREPKPKG